MKIADLGNKNSCIDIALGFAVVEDPTGEDEPVLHVQIAVTTSLYVSERERGQTGEYCGG